MKNRENNQTGCSSDSNFLLGIILRFVYNSATTSDTSHLSHKILCVILYKVDQMSLKKRFVSPKMLHHLGKSVSLIHPLYYKTNGIFRISMPQNPREPIIGIGKPKNR